MSDRRASPSRLSGADADAPESERDAAVAGRGGALGGELVCRSDIWSRWTDKLWRESERRGNNLEGYL